MDHQKLIKNMASKDGRALVRVVFSCAKFQDRMYRKGWIHVVYIFLCEAHCFTFRQIVKRDKVKLL